MEKHASNRLLEIVLLLLRSEEDLKGSYKTIERLGIGLLLSKRIVRNFTEILRRIDLG